MTNDQSVHFLTGGGSADPAAGSEPVDPNAVGAWLAPDPSLADRFGPQDGIGRPARPGRPSWRRLLPRSLTSRLVSGVVSLVVVLVLATGAGTYFALRSFLYERLDQQLQSATSQNAAYLGRCLRNLATTPMPNCFGGPPPTQTEWLTLISSTFSFESTDTNRKMLTLSAAQQAEIAADPSRVRTIDADGTELRVSAQTVAPGTVIVTGLSTDEVQRTLNRLILLELLIGASAVIVALGATTYGVRYSLRRLHGVADTAREVAGELSPEGAGLERRVDVGDADTEVGQLAESMNTLLAAVETQFAARLAQEQKMRQFLADASHELRTPLTSIRGYAELARMQRQQSEADEPVGPRAPAAADDAADHIARIESEGTRMSRLVDDLLTLARTDQGNSPPQRVDVDLDDLLSDAVAGARAAHPNRRIELSAPVGLHVIGDPDQLLRVVRNLVTNAAVHTRPDGPIAVTGAREGPWVVVRVADSGPGLPQDQTAQVFERFWRADKSRTRARGGSGLGLAIVASIVAAHGGTVRFDSSVEQGSTVTVALPVGTR